MFVQASITGVLREALIAACLTALMILVFLGSWRSTLIIAVSIPLSILCSIIVLSALGETINIMTLGGLALAVGILVDDATVEIENINRNLAQGKPTEEAILDGAQQIAVPALVSTLCICIVFVPMFFLTGVARYLFVPLAEAVVFAMLASYILSRTLVPTMAKFLLRPHPEDPHENLRSRNPLVRLQAHFEVRFEALRDAFRGQLEAVIEHRGAVRLGVPAALSALVRAAAVGRRGLLPRGRRRPVQAAPARDQRHAHRGDGDALRSRRSGRSARSFRRSELSGIIDNIGLPYSGLNLSYSTSAPIGPGDADIMVALSRRAPADGRVPPRAAADAAASAFPASSSRSCRPTSSPRF